MRKYINSVDDLEQIYNQGKTIQFSHLTDWESKSDGEWHKEGEASRFLSDKGEAQEDALSQLQAEWWVGKLTRRQQKVIAAMQSERKRRKVAEDLGVSLQAVNQIIIRIRRRIEIYQAMKD